jgi:hypothetical protein
MPGRSDRCVFATSRNLMRMQIMPVYHSIRVCSTSSSQNEKAIRRDLAARQFEELRTIDLDHLAVLTVTLVIAVEMSNPLHRARAPSSGPARTSSGSSASYRVRWYGNSVMAPSSPSSTNISPSSKSNRAPLTR